MLNLEIRAGTNEKQVRIIYLQYTYVPKCTFRCDLNCCIHNVFNYIQWVIFRSNHAIDKLMGWNWSDFLAIPIPTRPNFDCEAKILMNHICSNGFINSDVMAQKVWCGIGDVIFIYSWKNAVTQILSCKMPLTFLTYAYHLALVLDDCCNAKKKKWIIMPLSVVANQSISGTWITLASSLFSS